MLSPRKTAKLAHSVLVAVLGVVLIATLTASSARADDKPGKSDYEALIRSALNEYDAGRYDEAGALFGRAHELSPNARTYRGLGLTYYEGRKYALAVTHLRAALTDTRRGLTAAQREGTLKILHQAEGFVARVRVRLEPAGATLEVDGYATELKDGELLLDAGSHELIARAPDYAEERRRIEAIAGSSTEVQITLNPPQEVAATEPAPAETAAPAETSNVAQSAATSSGPGVGPYIVIGAGGALLIGALVTGLVAQNIHSDLDKRCPKGVCPAKDKDAASDKETGGTLVTATNVLLVSGGVVAAAGITWWILASGDETQPPVTAACGPTGCMASVQGRF